MDGGVLLEKLSETPGPEVVEATWRAIMQGHRHGPDGMALGGVDFEYPQYTWRELLSVAALVWGTRGMRDSVTPLASEVAVKLAGGEVAAASRLARWHGLKYLHPVEGTGKRVVTYLLRALELEGAE